MEEEESILRQPKAVWAVAFACVVAFMGLGLVDPILPAISEDLEATPSQVALLFSSYMFVTGIAMVVSGAIASRIGQKLTLLTGLALIVLFSALAGFSGSIGEIVDFRAGWGLGNALFIATALAVIVGVSSVGTEKAVILYEAALGMGISVGPLLGGLLGDISWRGPFFGVAALMAVGFVCVSVLLPEQPKPSRPSSVLDPFRALKHRGLLIMGLTALCYNYGFFTLLAYSPFPMELDAYGLGGVFFGWGLMLAVFSVFVAPRVQARLGTLATMYAVLALFALDLLIMGFGASSAAVLAVSVIVAGAFIGVNNTLLTTAVMEVSPVERSVASSSYSFIRFTGGALAPWLAGKLSEWYLPSTPFYFGAAAVALAMVVLALGHSYLTKI